MSASVLVQYIVVRRDLLESLKWPLGALMAQACHAATAAIFENGEHPDTREYLSNTNRMHKVVLSTNTDSDLLKLAEKLQSHNVDFKLWVEQPEAINTALATRPYRKSDIQSLFKGLSLFK